MENIVEYLRKTVVTDLFNLNSFNNAWPTWNHEIKREIPHLNPINIIDLGDKLGDIFKATSVSGRSQSTVSGAGTGWEALVCWYLNICLIGSRTVVVKQKISLIPEPIRQALTVSYGTFPSGTESDLIAITFPDRGIYYDDKHSIKTRGINGDLIPTETGRDKKYNYKNIIDALIHQHFNECEIGVIQCKTNWNDNAQIPMLWDMVYSSEGFKRQSITVGTSSYSINNLQRFSYSFVSVPTVNRSSFKPTSTSVKRVQNLSGGNYWGYPTQSSVANSLKDVFGKNFTNASPTGLVNLLNAELLKIETDYSYFRL